MVAHIVRIIPGGLADALAAFVAVALRGVIPQDNRVNAEERP